MTPYQAPVKDMLFNLQHIANLEALNQIPVFADANLDTAQAVLEECAKLVENVIAPLNYESDKNPSHLKDGKVVTAKGFKDAYAQFAAGGWQGLQHPPEWGGQGLPKAIASACNEMFQSGSMSFGLCPMLTDSAIEALLTAGTEAQKAQYLEKMVSGAWTGTMNLTEPQAGSDLSLVRTKAVPQPNGSYKLFGTKIYITYGDHDFTDNIVHPVLARVEGAPEGVKGISLFLVPKVLINADGSLGARNDVETVSLEHKLGIKSSPTAVLQYGANLKGSVADTAGAGAVSYLVGEENRGLEYMFIMMNAARFAVGVQGIALAERSYQQAVAYARDRVQSRPVDGSAPKAVPIIHHPDIRRMLMTMRAYTEGCRALSAAAAAAFDAGHTHPDAATRAENLAFYDWMVPLVKGYSTEMSQEVTSLGVQIHGGMGFMEETGAAQHYRDSKILTIYEGTTAIQANDLVGRKTGRDGGQTGKNIAAQMDGTLADLLGLQNSSEASVQKAAKAMHQRLGAGREALLQVIDFMAANGRANPNAAFAGSVPYLMLAGNVMAGWQMARSLVVAAKEVTAGRGTAFMHNKITTAQFYAEHILVKAPSVCEAIVHGADSVCGLAVEAF